MTLCFQNVSRRFSRIAILCSALFFAACSLRAGKAPVGAVPPAGPGLAGEELERNGKERPKTADIEIEDLSRIPQKLDGLADAAGNALALTDGCRGRLRDEFHSRFFAPWAPGGSRLDAAEVREFMQEEARTTWYGPNKRRVAPRQMKELLANCALESFPSRNDVAIAIAPGHLRGLPSPLPHYQHADDYPFDMFSYPQVKLNEPLRVLHASRDGVWLFVETGYTNGWLEARDVALVDGAFIDSWMQAPHLVVVRDYAPLADGVGGMVQAKVGTILPLVQAGAEQWEVAVASAGDDGRVRSRTVTIPRATAAPFPLEFSRENLALIGNQFLGEPYGWGEIYGLRDCSAMLRDFFLPFGIWLPRTSADQISSIPDKVALAHLTPTEKEETIRNQGVPFLTLLYKPGHIMLYVGVDSEGRPLLFQNAWSIRLKGGAAGDAAGGSEAGSTAQGERTQIIGVAAVTTLEPGKELGLVPGGSLLERLTELGVITNRCLAPPPVAPDLRQLLPAAQAPVKDPKP
jgi:hypothetical protein